MTPSRREAVKIFLLAWVMGWAWSLYTNHVWEDYFITYRSAKNLATGHGLVFTVGERLHTFTSPLGVLLPALSYLLTGNSSDDAAIWIFRFFSITAFGGAAVLLWQLAREKFRATYPAILLAALLLTDAKSIDFSTNGMETGLMLLFLAWMLKALLTDAPRRSMHLGLAWAGMMWTRPDSFIYIGALTAGAWLFRPRASPSTPDRWQEAKVFLTAGAIAAACYLPWLLWSWSYYGSPVPNTILAKGLDRPPVNFGVVVDWLVDLPSRLVRPESALAATFMPPYAHDEKAGWLLAAVGLSRLLALGVGLVWLVPVARWEARVTSLAFAAGHLYLMYFASFHYPWYLPTITALGFVTLAFLTGQGAEWVADQRAAGRPESSWRAMRRTYLAATLWLPVGGFVLLLCAAHQLKLQQRIIEIGQRKQIGLWLREHARPGQDRVFLEPLGYIGFYSGLKMFDYPGLSSVEMLAARRRLLREHPERRDREGWPDLIRALQPDWLVLRGFEATRLRGQDVRLLRDFYQLEKTFDASEPIRAARFLPGRPYLYYDENFQVYHRSPGVTAADFGVAAPGRAEITLESIHVIKAFAEFKKDGRTLLTHVPAIFRQTIPAGALTITGSYGFFDGAYHDPASHTPGAEFNVVLLAPDGRRQVLLNRFVQPFEQTSDRGPQNFVLKLPAGAKGEIEFSVAEGRGGNNMYGWTYWKELEFELPLATAAAQTGQAQ